MKLYTNLTTTEAEAIVAYARPDRFIAMGVERYVENSGARYWLVTTVAVTDDEGMEF